MDEEKLRFALDTQSPEDIDVILIEIVADDFHCRYAKHSKIYEFIVDKALEFKLGARGLRSIVEAVMMDAMYSMPSQKVKELHVTLEYAKEKFEKSDVNRLQVA